MPREQGRTLACSSSASHLLRPAHVLMTHHVHLLIAPDTAESLPRSESNGKGPA